MSAWLTFSLTFTGKVAGDARKAIETQTGVPVITSKNAAQLSEVVTNLLEDAGNKEK